MPKRGYLPPASSASARMPEFPRSQRRLSGKPQFSRPRIILLGQRASTSLTPSKIVRLPSDYGHGYGLAVSAKALPCLFRHVVTNGKTKKLVRQNRSTWP